MICKLKYLVLCVTFVFADWAEENMRSPAVTAETYAELLPSIRKDHSILIQRMLYDDYSKNYKMISLALDKIFQVMRQNYDSLHEASYNPSDGFPTYPNLQEAVTLLIENTCLAADIILHFPDISYKILRNMPNWKATMNWCIDFVKHFENITDEKVARLINLIYQEINEDARSPDFINPYYEQVSSIDAEPKKIPKQRKKLLRGPRLTKTEL